MPSNDDWLLKIIAIEDRFVLGLYRREMKAISYLGKIKKQLGGRLKNIQHLRLRSLDLQRE